MLTLERPWLQAAAPSRHPLAPLTTRELRRFFHGRRRGKVMDFFAGGGGFGTGAELVGLELALAANHWVRSYESHAENFPHAERLLGDLSVKDPKKFSRNLATILLSSPECRHHSDARNYREAVAELSPYNSQKEAERSRCTMWCPMRFAAWMRFEFVICENVVQVTKWNQFENWVKEWNLLGYHVDAVSANSAFFDNPQSRDRVFFVMTRMDIPRPNLDFRPPVWCWRCEKRRHGVQTWKPVALANEGPAGPIGKFGPRGQYLYKCEVCNEVAAPYITPARTAIDWTLDMPRICDRKALGLPVLTENTLERIVLGLMRMGMVEQLTLVTGQDPKTQRSRPVWLPAMTQTTRQEIALFGPGDDAMMVYARNHVQPTSVGHEPTLALCASGNHHGVLAGPDEAYLSAYNGSGHNMRPIDVPAGTQVASDRHSIVVPTDAARSLAAIDDFVRLQTNVNVQEARFRMLQWWEAAGLMGLTERADGSPYVLVGSGRDKVRQAGNAVVPTIPANVLHRCLMASGA